MFVFGLNAAPELRRNQLALENAELQVAREKFYFDAVKHSGKAAARRAQTHWLSLAAVLVLLVVALLAAHIGSFIVGMAGVLGVLWVLFVAFHILFLPRSGPGVAHRKKSRPRARPRQSGHD